MTLPAPANVAFLECLPIGVVIFTGDGEVWFVNRWLRGQLDSVPRDLKEIGFWGETAWGEFVRGVPAMREAAEGNFILAIGKNGRLQVSVSVHRLKGQLEGAIVMVVSDVSSLRTTQENLRETLAHVGQLTDTMIAQSLELKHLNEALEERVLERTAELRYANMDALQMLAVACEAKDQDTGEHVQRVRRYTEAIAREMGLGEAQSIEIGYSSILHDVGKVQVPDAILMKPSALSAEERRIMQSHAAAGERILGSNPFFAMARRIARGHHENWDGSGYPDGKAGPAISLEARIVHVADVFDALTSDRPYKRAWPAHEALKAIREKAGVHFDGEVVNALESLVRRGL